jgi:hypothetical protein
MESGVVYRSMEDDGAGCPKVGNAANQLGVRPWQSGERSDFNHPGDTVSPNGEGLSVVPHRLENFDKLFRMVPAIVPRKLAVWGFERAARLRT